MYTTSAKFQEAITQSHTKTYRVEAYDGTFGELLYTGTPKEMLDGEISIGPGSVRRRLTARFVDSTGLLTPETAADMFTPFGNEVKVWRGIQFSDGTTEDVPLGVFVLTDVDISDGGESVQIQVSGFDRSERVSRSKLINTYTIPGGTPYSEAIEDLLLWAVGDLAFNIQITEHTTPRIILDVGSDPWEEARKMAASIGYELFFDVDGLCVLREVQDPYDAETSWEYVEGEDTTLLSVNKRLTSEGVYNYFIVTGESSSNAAPVRGDAYDDNPSSPTYRFGPFGTSVAPVERSPLVTTAAQAQAAATGRLQSQVGVGEKMHFNSLVNPAHDVGDVVRVKRERLFVDNLYVLSRASIPLTHNRAMDLGARLRSVQVTETA